MSELVVPVDQTRAVGFLGASDVPAALGLVKCRSPMSVWMQLRGQTVDDVPPAVREAAEFGQLFEPVIRGRYAMLERKRVLVPKESITLDGWLRCTPDGYVCDALDHQDIGTEEWMPGPVNADDRYVPLGARGLVQIKCRSAWQADDWADGPPPAEEVQCRVEMAVANLPWNDCVVVLGGNRYLKYRIERDLAIEDKIVRDAKLFWTGVLVGQPPVVDGSDAWNQYASSKMSATKVSIPANDDLRAYLVELRQARIERKRAERQEEEIKVKCLLALSAASATVIDGGDLGSLTAYQNPARMDWHAYADYVVGGLPAAERAKLRPSDDFKKPGKGWAIRTPRSWSQEDE